jgi:hypothetical protein
LAVKAALSDFSRGLANAPSTDKADKPHAERQLKIKPTATAILVGIPTFVVPSDT